MVDYISSEGYYGLKPMLPYEYAGGITYNAIHNTGISNWIAGPPAAARRSGARSPRAAATASHSGAWRSRAAVRCRTAVRASTTAIWPSSARCCHRRRRTWRASSRTATSPHCYDVFDPKGDGDERVMGVQYYIAFRHTDARVMQADLGAERPRELLSLALRRRDDLRPTRTRSSIKEACDGRFVGRKAREGEHLSRV